MSNWMKIVWPGAKTFFIGSVAGIAPFLFMQILPGMLQSDSASMSVTPAPICMTGFIVGVITMIIFAKDAGSGEPQHENRDIFFYALGIPAILIAMISNIGQQMTTNQVKASASENIINRAVEDNTVENKIKEIDMDAILQGQASNFTDWFRPNLAYADDKKPPSAATPPASEGDVSKKEEKDTIPDEPAAPGRDSAAKPKGNSGDTYLVTIGRFNSVKDPALRETLKHSMETTFITEQYVTKELNVVEIDGNPYIVYSKHGSKENAEKTYKLLRVNDPNTKPQIFKVPNRFQ